MRTTRRGIGDGKRTAESPRSRAPFVGLVAAVVLSGGCASSPTVTAPTAIAVGGPGSTTQPSFAATVTASVPPPPISGGTLIVTKDGTLAVVSDPDRDAVYVVDLGTQKVSHTIALHAGDEPGRLVEDGAGRVQVALRSGGALVTIDPESGSVITRRSVCPAPRGVAWDMTTDLVWVACATGELVALPSAGGSSTRSLVLERDLRDVVISNGSLSVTNFRTAEVLRVGSDGSISRRDQLPSPLSTFTPHVAWRVIGAPSGAVVAVHQAETTQSLSTVVQGGYGGGACGGLALPPGLAVPVSSGGGVADDAAVVFSPGVADFADSGGNPSGMEDAGPGVAAEASGNCFAGAPGVGVAGGPTGSGAGSPPVGPGCGPESGAVISVLTVLTADGTVTVNTSFLGVLPVDVAVSPDGSLVAAVAPGNSFAPLSTVFEFSSCGSPVSVTPSTTLQQPIAVAFDSKDDLVVQTREPAQLSIVSSGGTTTIPLSTTTRADTGYDVFHTQAGGMIACASCHPEGRDDGFVWTLNGDRRRTPSLRGTIAGTAPYHWPGDEPDLNVLVNDVYTVRMSGASLNTDQMGAIANWVEHVSPPPAPSWVDAASAQRGKALFESASTGCATCHSGAKFTNNLTMDVGTGGKFQVPPLVGVGWSTPLLHNGCAATLADRFGACATPQHGATGALPQQNVSDLVAYLETL